MSQLKKYLVLRHIPNAGAKAAGGAKAFRDDAIRSNAVLAQLGSDNIRWVSSVVSDNHVVCTYEATGPDIIKKHGELAGFPVTGIFPVLLTINPNTAEAS